MDKSMNKCISCGTLHPEPTWFCSRCNTNKEFAYKICRMLHISNYWRVIIVRDTFLKYGNFIYYMRKNIKSYFMSG